METQAKLAEIVTDITAKQQFVTTMLQRCPKGRLLKTRNNGKTSILRVDGCGKHRTREAVNKDHRTQVLLARRMVLEKQLDQLDREYETVAKALSVVSALKEFDSRRFAIEHFTWFTNKEIEECCAITSDNEWENEPYERFDYMPDALIHATSRGLMVRSKSEVLIAEALNRHGLPFRYEQKYTVDNKYTLSADFTIRRVDGKVFVWEHEGLTNIRSYIDRQRRKAELFAKLGFVPWDNLIISYDTADGALDLRIVESEIRNKLLV